MCEMLDLELWILLNDECVKRKWTDEWIDKLDAIWNLDMPAVRPWILHEFLKSMFAMSRTLQAVRRLYNM